MDRIPVTLSNLASVGYDSSSQTLEVEFRNGSIYQYFGVSPDIYEGLLNAPSKGSYFYQRIRNVYPYSRVA